jgi:hypothetical protein
MIFPEHGNIYFNTWVLTLNKTVLFILENTHNSLDTLNKRKDNIPKKYIYYLFSSNEQDEEALIERCGSATPLSSSKLQHWFTESIYIQQSRKYINGVFTTSIHMLSLFVRF